MHEPLLLDSRVQIELWKSLKLIFFSCHENMKKPASKVAKPAQIQPKSQFLLHKCLPPRDYPIMTLAWPNDMPHSNCLQLLLPYMD